MTTASRPAPDRPVPGHVAWVARRADDGSAGGPEGDDRDERALLALASAALDVGIRWLTVQDPAAGAGLGQHAAALAGRGIALVGAPESPVPGHVSDADRPALRVLLAEGRSGKRELVEAVRQVAATGTRPKAVKEATIAGALAVPDVDLLVLTGGDRRMPDLLPWQVAYSEIVVLDEPWPEVTGAQLLSAVSEYQRRDRRYGGLVTSR